MNLTKKDYKFVEEFSERFGMGRGKGERILLEVFLDEYKRWSKKDV